jgi:DeoR/GlpR family transcriptional regulator of sugar metabolism
MLGLVIAAERRSLILEMIRLDGVVSIAAAAERLGTSTVTVRRDLDQLATGGLVSRTHGGAVASGATRESPYAEKLQLAAEEKARIAAAAAELVHDGETLVIGPGTTTEALARHLVHRSGLTVVTNSLVVADVLAGSDEHDVLVTGGALRSSIRALVGDQAVSTFRGVHADKTFLSGNGLAADFGLSTPAASVADADRAMAAAGYQVIVLADHTKIGVRTALRTVPTAEIAQLVTDRASARQELDALEEAGVQLHVV